MPKSCELFDALIRVLGVWYFVQGLELLLMLVSDSLPNPHLGSESAIVYLILGIGLRLIAGLMLIFGADRIVRFVYRRDRSGGHDANPPPR